MRAEKPISSLSSAQFFSFHIKWCSFWAPNVSRIIASLFRIPGYSVGFPRCLMMMIPFLPLQFNVIYNKQMSQSGAFWGEKAAFVTVAAAVVDSICLPFALIFWGRCEWIVLQYKERLSSLFPISRVFSPNSMGAISLVTAFEFWYQAKKGWKVRKGEKKRRTPSTWAAILYVFFFLLNSRFYARRNRRVFPIPKN